MVVHIGLVSGFFNIVQLLGMAVGGLLLVLFKRGPAAARHLGWRSTASPYIALTDDDCVPHRDFLRQAPSSARVMAGMLRASIRNCTLVL